MSPHYRALLNELIVEGKTKEEAERQMRALLRSNADLGLLLKGCEEMRPPRKKGLIEKIFDLDKHIKK